MYLDTAMLCLRTYRDAVDLSSVEQAYSVYFHRKQDLHT
jgi:hypothetical protein